MDGPPPQEPPPYIYAASDNAPRQAREIELCKRASSFDWMYSLSAVVATVGAEYLNLQVLKPSEEPGIRLIGPGLIGFTWGFALQGSWLALPKCDPQWAYGPPPEGNVRADWPLAITISMVAIVTSPAMDYVFLGAVPQHWTTLERGSRVGIAMATGLGGSLLPFVLPPRTWRAAKEIEKIRVNGTLGGAYISYGLTF